MKQLIAKLTVLKNENGLSSDEIKALDKFIADITPATGFLKLLSRDHVAKATDGNYSRKEFKKVFTGWLDEDIENYGCSDQDAATAEVKFDRHTLVKNGTFMQMFGEAGTFGENSDKLFFTKAQIKSIFENNPELFFEDGRGHFFFYKNKKGERFVFGVYRLDGKWRLNVYRLEDDSVWDAKYGRVVFLPQQ